MSYATSKYRTPDPARVDQRQDKRHIVMLRKASVRRKPTEVYEAKISEISVYGCRLFTKAPFDVGDAITLNLPVKDDICAVVVWREDGLMGCRFDEALDREILRQMTLHIG